MPFIDQSQALKAGAGAAEFANRGLRKVWLDEPLVYCGNLALEFLL